MLLGLAGCVAEPIPVQDPILNTPRYLRYTLRGQQQGFYTQTHRSNYLSFPAVYRPGTKVEFVLYGDTRIDMNMDGLPAKMFHRDSKFPTLGDPMRQFLDKHFAKTKEELKLDAIEASTRRQIEAGNAAINMTKNEVLMAIGYPSHIDNYVLADDLSRERVLESNQWIYRYSEFGPFPTYWTYQFNSEGKLGQVIR